MAFFRIIPTETAKNTLGCRALWFKPVGVNRSENTPPSGGISDLRVFERLVDADAKTLADLKRSGAAQPAVLAANVRLASSRSLLAKERSIEARRDPPP